MKANWIAGGLLLVLYLLWLTATAPARLLAPMLPPGVQVGQFSGSVWRGAAQPVYWHGERLERLAWSLTLAGWQVSLSDPRGVMGQARLWGLRDLRQPMQDVSELRLLAGMDAALYQRLLPFVCVQPDDALQVNVNTLRPSQAALLVALFPGDLTLQEAQQLLHNRPRTGWSSVAAFLAQPTLQKTDTTLARPWLTVHSARFIAAFTVVTGNLRFQLYSVLQQSGRTFTVVQRRYGLSMVVDEQD